MISIIDFRSRISLRLVDWFVTNYSKKYYTVFWINQERFKVYNDYKLKLKSYSKRRFDPFCRWERISIPYFGHEKQVIETTLGQLNFFKWAIENKILEYIETNYEDIERDMNTRNSSSRRTEPATSSSDDSGLSVDDVMTAETVLSSLQNQTRSMRAHAQPKTRRRREELSISACKCIKRENVQITLQLGTLIHASTN
jgi:hypothetical protein